MGSIPPAAGAPWAHTFAGRLDVHTVDSAALRGNPLGDPHQRPLVVYVPPGAEDAGPLPVIYQIQGFTGQVDMWFNRTPFRPTYLERLDALFADPAVPRALVAHVDAWTSVGGSQFLDSPGTGRYHTYLCEDVVGFVDATYDTLADRDHRGIAGKSSGGYGAMVTPMLRPDVFGALATHAGDAGFELCYLHDEAKAVRVLRDRYEGSWEKFFEDFRSRPAMANDDDGDILNAYAMAACYSADEDGTVHHPIDVATGTLIDEVWARWQAWDPVRMAPRPRRRAALPEGDLDRRRHPRRVVPRPRRAGLQRGLPGRRRDRHPLRALRRRPRRHRVPLPPRRPPPRGAPQPVACPTWCSRKRGCSWAASS